MEQFIIKLSGERGKQESVNNIDASTLIDDVFIKRTESSSELYLRWGSDNKLPYKMLKLILDSPLLLPLLNFKIDIAAGQELTTFVKKEGVLEQKDFPEFEEFKEMVDLETFVEKSLTDWYFFGNIFCEILLGKTSKIVGLNILDSTTCRPYFAPIGQESKSYLINPDYNNYQQKFNLEVAKFDPLKKQSKSILHTKNYFPASSDFGVASWLGSSQFVEYLNTIPTFKKSLINNIATPSFMVTIPSDYFNVVFPNHTPEEIKEERKKLREDIETFLQGSQNAGKTLLTYVWKDLQGRDMQIKIEPIKNEIPDSLFTADFEQMFQVICSTTQVPPSLASILIPGKLSSGSDILNSYNAYIARIQRHRKKILQPLELVKKLNGWSKDIVFGFVDKELKTLDQHHSGQELQFNQV